MSYYVKRIAGDSGRVGWTGPIRSAPAALREAAAWFGAGWSTEIVLATREVRAEVRVWQRAADVRHGRRSA